MKTTWAQAYLNKRMAPRQQLDWCKVKAAELQRRTQVPWTWVNLAGKVSFRPYLTMGPLEPYTEQERGELLLCIREQNVLFGHPGAVGFARLAFLTTWSLPRVLRVARQGIKAGWLTPEVDRSDKVTGVRRAG